jgi:hypothetical protein
MSSLSPDLTLIAGFGRWRGVRPSSDTLAVGFSATGALRFGLAGKKVSKMYA